MPNRVRTARKKAPMTNAGDELSQPMASTAWTPPSDPNLSRAPLPPQPQTLFRFDGGAATYFGTGLLAFLITVFTLGICYPFAVVLMARWRAKHTWLNGRQLRFTGSATG